MNNNVNNKKHHQQKADGKKHRHKHDASTSAKKRNKLHQIQQAGQQTNSQIPETKIKSTKHQPIKSRR